MTVKVTLSRRLKDGNTDGKNGWQCSRYAAYLATGKKTIYSKAHPDYGPCNGSAMVNYLIKTYGWEKCKKEAGAIFSIPVRKGFPFGHCGVCTDPKVNEVNDANWVRPLTVGTHRINLEYYGATYCRPKTKAPEPTPTPAKKIKVGDTVIVNGAGTGNSQGGGGKTRIYVNQKMKVIKIENSRYGCNQYNKKGAVTGWWTDKQVKKA
jgi:hypothetical protein